MFTNDNFFDETYSTVFEREIRIKLPQWEDGWLGNYVLVYEKILVFLPFNLSMFSHT